MACFIGFGSLVNTSTHKYQPLASVRVPGWSRAWINNNSYDYAFLSVIPAPQQAIFGLLAAVPDENWAELDTREAGYSRKLLTPTDWRFEPGEFQGEPDTDLNYPDVQMYVHDSGDFAQPEKPILYSYLETVLFGFYRIFGEKGLENFIDTTTAWTAIKDDRPSPIYPRHVPPEGAACRVVEAAISRLRSHKNIS